MATLGAEFRTVRQGARLTVNLREARTEAALKSEILRRMIMNKPKPKPAAKTQKAPKAKAKSLNVRTGVKAGGGDDWSG